MAFGTRFTDWTTTVTVTNGTTGILTSYSQGSVDQFDETTTDKLKVVLLSSLSTVQATLANLHGLFRQAKRFAVEHLGSRVYIERDLGDSTWWRSELLDAVIQVEDGSLDTQLAAGKIEFTLVLTRRNYWEGSETAVPLTNVHGTDVTTGLTVDTFGDNANSRNDYVDIDGVNDLTGDLPTPIKLELENTTVGIYSLGGLYLGLNFRSPTPSSFVHIYEGESATGMTALPASPDTALYSGGKYGQLITTDGGESDIYWSFTNSSQTKGNYYKILAQFTEAPPAGTNVKFLVKCGSNTLEEYPYVELEPYLFNPLGIVRLPPYFLNVSSYKNLELHMTFKVVGGSGSKYHKLDYIKLVPLDCYRYLYPSYLCIQNEKLIDDSISDMIYVTDASGNNAVYSATPIGDKIYLEPGLNQRLFFDFSSGDVDMTAKAKIWYRPRRLVL